MKMFLDTSTDTAILKLDDKTYEETFGHDMAEKLLGFIKDKLEENGKTWQDIESIDFNNGPGSFTGLRIGASIVNTLIHELNLPQKPFFPDYGRGANITKPVK
jgi:tRNA threonylcarbamoyladenosine biosynthesis protein TsaB